MSRRPALKEEPDMEYRGIPAIYIAEPRVAEKYYGQLRDWFESEWHTLDPFFDAVRPLPAPVVALTVAESLAGGLAFTRAKSPLDDTPEIWINAVFVAPAYRRQGIAKLLVKTAEAAVRRFGSRRLFARTDIPGLYARTGWSQVSNQGGDHVMMRVIESDA